MGNNITEINKMNFTTTLSFLKKTLVNSASRFWQNLDEATKQEVMGTDTNIANLISKAVETCRI